MNATSPSSARRQWLRRAALALPAGFVLSAGLSSTALVPAFAQAPGAARRRPPHDPKVAAPFLMPSQFVRNALALHFVPAAQAFEKSAAALATQLASSCETPDGHAAARELWRAALLDWERLSAVAVGPLIDRRSARAIDFWPTRPAMIETAVRGQPADLAALQRIGTPAKGLPALEWLLWQNKREAAHCAYAALLARECEAEAKALREAFEALAAREWEDEDALPVLHDWIGQTVGGLEQLRWKKMGKPAHSGRKNDFPRALSGSTRAAWQAGWDSLERMLLGPAGGSDQGSLDGLLRGRGHLALSADLERATVRAGAAVAAADPARPATVTAATQALGRNKALVEDKAAGALQITVGFSDADGD